jgi:hypothetical protein
LPSLQFTGVATHCPVVALHAAGLHGSVEQTLGVKVQFPPAQESTVHGLLSLQTTGEGTHEPLIASQVEGKQRSAEAQSMGVKTHVALLPATAQASSVQRLLSSQR